MYVNGHFVFSRVVQRKDAYRCQNRNVDRSSSVAREARTSSPRRARGEASVQDSANAIGFEKSDAGPIPLSLRAAILNRYVLPTVKPLIVALFWVV
jgi:hypothetical protein